MLSRLAPGRAGAFRALPYALEVITTAMAAILIKPRQIDPCSGHLFCMLLIALAAWWIGWNPEPAD